MNITVPIPNITTSQSPSSLPTTNISNATIINQCVIKPDALVHFLLSCDRTYCWTGTCVGIWYWCDALTGSSSDTGSASSPIVLSVEKKQIVICESERFVILQ